MYPKIDFFLDGVYICSTNMSPNCKVAKQRFLANLTYAGLRPDGTLGMCKVPKRFLAWNFSCQARRATGDSRWNGAGHKWTD